MQEVSQIHSNVVALLGPWPPRSEIDKWLTMHLKVELFVNECDFNTNGENNSNSVSKKGKSHGSKEDPGFTDGILTTTTVDGVGPGTEDTGSPPSACILSKAVNRDANSGGSSSKGGDNPKLTAVLVSQESIAYRRAFYNEMNRTDFYNDGMSEAPSYKLPDKIYLRKNKSTKSCTHSTSPAQAVGGSLASSNKRIIDTTRHPTELNECAQNLNQSINEMIMNKASKQADIGDRSFGFTSNITPVDAIMDNISSDASRPPSSRPSSRNCNRIMNKYADKKAASSANNSRFFHMAKSGSKVEDVPYSNTIVPAVSEDDWMSQIKVCFTTNGVRIDPSTTAERDLAPKGESATTHVVIDSFDVADLWRLTSFFEVLQFRQDPSDDFPSFSKDSPDGALGSAYEAAVGGSSVRVSDQQHLTPGPPIPGTVIVEKSSTVHVQHAEGDTSSTVDSISSPTGDTSSRERCGFSIVSNSRFSSRSAACQPGTPSRTGQGPNGHGPKVREGARRNSRAMRHISWLKRIFFGLYDEPRMRLLWNAASYLGQEMVIGSVNNDFSAYPTRMGMERRELKKIGCEIFYSGGPKALRLHLLIVANVHKILGVTDAALEKACFEFAERVEQAWAGIGGWNRNESSGARMSE